MICRLDIRIYLEHTASKPDWPYRLFAVTKLQEMQPVSHRPARPRRTHPAPGRNPCYRMSAFVTLADHSREHRFWLAASLLALGAAGLSRYFRAVSYNRWLLAVSHIVSLIFATDVNCHDGYRADQPAGRTSLSPAASANFFRHCQCRVYLQPNAW